MKRKLRMNRILSCVLSLMLVCVNLSFGSLVYAAQADLVLEGFNTGFQFTTMNPQETAYSLPTFELTDTNTDQGTALRVNWAPTDTQKAAVHRMEPNAAWVQDSFTSYADDYAYLRIWVANPTFIAMDLSVTLSDGVTQVYMNTENVLLTRKDGTKSTPSQSNAAGYGDNSSVQIPSSFSGWVAYPLSLDALTPAGEDTQNLTDFADVTTIQIDVRRPETLDTDAYYILDDISLSDNHVGVLRSLGEEDYKVDDGGPIETELKNVIVMVGDGMGQTTLQATRDYKGSDLYMDDMWYISKTISSNNASEQLTDSAAGGTALSCGVRTLNGRVALDEEGNAVENMVEFFNRAGKKTGLVTTSYLLDATPGTYGGRASDRSNYAAIAKTMFENDISVLLGGGTDHFGTSTTYEGQNYTLTSLAQTMYGYSYVNNADALRDFDGEKVLGLFAPGYMDFEADRTSQMSISEMTEKAISLLENQEEGFFLMVEGGRIDHGGHNNDFERTVTDTIAFDEAVKVALDYMEKNPDTLVVVCADHSTGGLVADESSADGYKFTTGNHDPSKTACFASGLGSRFFVNLTENADIANAVRTATLNVKSGEDDHPVETALSVASGLDPVTIYGGDATKLTLPEIPKGFTIELAESSNTDVVALDGTLTHSNVTGKATVKFRVTGEDGETAISAPYTILVAATRSENIALNKPASASSEHNKTDYLATFAFDGNMETRWAAIFSGYTTRTNWLTVDLRGIYQINEVGLKFELDYPVRPYLFKVEVSTDGETWTEFSTEYLHNESLQRDFDVLGAAEGRYVRVSFNDAATEFPSLWEMEVYGLLIDGNIPEDEEPEKPEEPEEPEEPKDPEEDPITRTSENLALNKPITGTVVNLIKGYDADANIQNGDEAVYAGDAKYAVANAVDGNVETFWAARWARGGSELIIDLEEVCNFGEVWLSFPEKPTDYHHIEISVSEDGETWTAFAPEVYAVSENAETGEFSITNKDGVNARYVKLYFLFLKPDQECDGKSFANGTEFPKIPEIEIYSIAVADEEQPGEKPEEPGGDESSKPSVDENSKPNSSTGGNPVPPTGESNYMWLWIPLFFVSGGVALAFILATKKDLFTK